MTGTATMKVGQFGRPMLSKDGRTIMVRIPITLRRQGGRKQVVTPAGATPWIPTPPRIDNTLVKAMVRAHRWRDMLESGDYATVRDLANSGSKTESIAALPPRGGAAFSCGARGRASSADGSQGKASHCWPCWANTSISL